MDRSSQDPQALAEGLEREADELEHRSHELERKIDAARSDWERKRADPGVPGAPPHREETGPRPGDGEPELDPGVPPDDQPAAG